MLSNQNKFNFFFNEKVLSHKWTIKVRFHYTRKKKQKTKAPGIEGNNELKGIETNPTEKKIVKTILSKTEENSYSLQITAEKGWN